MIDYSELINRISDMQDLPVSEEMLGAYCEGTLGSADAAVMDSCIANNAEIGELVDSVDNLHVADDTYLLGYSTESIDLPDVPMVGAFNPFEIDITPNIDNIGMVAFAADSAFCGITDDFVSGSDDFISYNDDITSSDDRFSSNGNSLKIKGDINNDNPHDDLNINNDNSLI